MYYNKTGSFNRGNSIPGAYIAKQKYVNNMIMNNILKVSPQKLPDKFSLTAILSH